MTLEGIVENGNIVLINGATLPDGTPVKVTVVLNKRTHSDARSFFHSATIDEIAAAQDKTSPCSFDDLLGGWPEAEKGDGFEEAVASWRKDDVWRGEF